MFKEYVQEHAGAALMEAIAIEDPALADEGALASAVTGDAVASWLETSRGGVPIVNPLLTFRAHRNGRDERIAVHVSESGRLTISVSRLGEAGWRRHEDMYITPWHLYPLNRMLAAATGDAARIVAIGQRIGRAVAAAH